jgi:replicative DNA helicase
MATFNELMDTRSPQTFLGAVSTGFQDLDLLTGGFQQGALWVVLGTPGVGRTVLATQLALHAALRSRASSALVLGREPSALALLNTYSQVARVPVQRLQTGTESPEDAERLAKATQELRGIPLSVWSCVDRMISSSDPELIERINLLSTDGPLARIVVLDDADHCDWLYWGEKPGLMGQLATLRNKACVQGTTVIVTTPEEGWLDGERLLAHARREADVVLRVTRADQFERMSPRAGEADFEILNNRSGPTGIITVAFQGHYRRFVDMASSYLTRSESGRPRSSGVVTAEQGTTQGAAPAAASDVPRR